MNDKGYSVFIGISHPLMSPDEITAALQLEPEHAHKAGDPHVSVRRPLESSYSENYWGRVMFGGALPQPPLSDVLTEITERFSEKKAFFQKICAEGGRIDLRIFWVLDDDSVGEFFSAALLRQIGDLGMDISLTIYP